jgi:hypothetical protein
MQLDCPKLPWYFLTGHAMQLVLMPAPAPAYDPAGHAPLHVADVPAPVST